MMSTDSALDPMSVNATAIDGKRSVLLTPLRIDVCSRVLTRAAPAKRFF